MKFIGNIIWLLIVGIGSAISWFVLGAIWCVTIIGIPFGLQCFKMARIYLWPMGAEVRLNFGKHPIANVIWFIFGGFEMAVGLLLAALLFCVTIIGIPFGLQCFKLAKLAAFPFGADVH